MNDPHLDSEMRIYIDTRNCVLAEYADLDEQTLADTVEGLTNFIDMLAADVRAALDDETTAEALSDRIEKMDKRRKRIENRAERRREIVRDAMERAGIKKINKEDFTAFLRAGSPGLMVIDETLIPEPFFKTIRELRRGELRKELMNGAQIAGAELSNTPTVLNVRT